jgi:hypothetical protein
MAQRRFQGGHDETWVNEKDASELICPICTLVARAPVAHSCGQLFCQACFDTWGNDGKHCSHCRSPGDVFPAPRDLRTINNLLMRCPNECNETYRLGDKLAHTTSQCQNRAIPCPNNCSQQTTPRLLQVHLTTACHHRRIPCPECSAATTPATLDDHKAHFCLHREVSCDVCGESVKCSELVNHVEAKAGEHLVKIGQCMGPLQEQNRMLAQRIMQIEDAHETLQNEFSEFKSQIQQYKNEKNQEVAQLESDTNCLQQVLSPWLEMKVQCRRCKLEIACKDWSSVCRSHPKREGSRICKCSHDSAGCITSAHSVRSGGLFGSQCVQQ